MGFLDNSGNIILDATLTDLGRARLAKGEFRVSKFALFDDEVSYSNYDKNHTSGSAYYDLEILQTPILEAFSNNTSYGNSKLLSISRTNLLYLPILALNDIKEPSTNMHASGAFMLAVDSNTETDFNNTTGIMKGVMPGAGGSYIRVDQGLDTTEINAASTIDADLVETQYIIEMDNRFCKLCDTGGNLAAMSYLDDDNIASYYLSLNTDNTYVFEHEAPDLLNLQNGEVIAGPRGTVLKFKLASSIDTQTSTYLFDLVGSTATMMSTDGVPTSVYYIDTIIKVSGATTGYKLDLSVRLIKNA